MLSALTLNHGVVVCHTLGVPKGVTVQTTVQEDSGEIWRPGGREQNYRKAAQKHTGKYTRPLRAGLGLDNVNKSL